MDLQWLENAIKVIQDKVVDKLSKDNITVYRVKDIIRIDIKD